MEDPRATLRISRYSAKVALRIQYIYHGAVDGTVGSMLAAPDSIHSTDSSRHGRCLLPFRL